MTRLQQAAIGLTPLLLAATPAAPVSPAPNPDPIGPALHRIAQDRYTSSDLALIRQHPKLAAKVPDPTQTPVLHASTGLASRSHDTTAVRTLGTCGHWVDVWFRKRSLLGKTLYKWHHRVVYCRTGRKVTDWKKRYDYLTDASSVVYFRGLEVNEQDGIGTAAAWSHRQRHIEFCIASEKIGCYASLHPWSRIKVYAGGGYSYKGDNS